MTEFQDVKQKKKIERDSFDYCSTEIVRWKDNVAATLGSKTYGLESIQKLKWKFKGKNKQNISQQFVAAQYNSGLGALIF